MARTAKPITSEQLFDALTGAGIVGRDERVRRVVIDARFDSVPVVYVERLGDDERLLSVVQTLGGAEIDVVRPDEEAKRGSST
jgi:hypothetical protein